MKKAVKSRKLAQELREQIFKKEIRAGELLPYELVLAEQHQISRATVRAALVELESEHLIRRIRGKGTIVSPPIQVCSAIKVALPGPGPLKPAMFAMMRGIIAEAHQQGIRLETIMSTCDNVQAHMDRRSFESLTPDDCVILPDLVWWRPVLPQIATTRCRVVCLDNAYSTDTIGTLFPYIQHWKCIRLDFTALICDALRYFLKQGRKRTIIFELSPTETSVYFNELRQNHIEFDHRWFIPYQYGFGVSEDKKQQRKNLRSYLMPLIKQAVFEARADSIIFNNPILLEAVMEIFRELEIQLPDDLSAVAVVDYPRIHNLNYPVSAFQYSKIELGRSFVRCFLDPYFHPELQIVPQSILERESSCKGAGYPAGIPEEESFFPADIETFNS